MNFFKWIIIVKLKMSARANFLVTFVSKNYQSYLFSKHVVCDQEGMGWDMKESFDACFWNRLTGINTFLKFETYLKLLYTYLVTWKKRILILHKNNYYITPYKKLHYSVQLLFKQMFFFQT